MPDPRRKGLFGAPMQAMPSLFPMIAQGGIPVSKPTPPQPWQTRYAKKNWQQSLTRLDPRQEAQFQAWAQKTRAPITDDYDMRGFWRSGEGTVVNANDGMPHFTDRFKTPLHQSFSGESMYADPATRPPMWNDRDQLVGSDGVVIFDEREEARRHRR